MESAIRKGYGIMGSQHPQVNGSLSPSAVRDIVRHYGGLIGVELAPHDLRRTHAKLARLGGASLESVCATLGHASIQTTMRYIGSCDAADAGNFIQVDDGQGCSLVGKAGAAAEVAAGSSAVDGRPSASAASRCLGWHDRRPG